MKKFLSVLLTCCLLFSFSSPLMSWAEEAGAESEALETTNQLAENDLLEAPEPAEEDLSLEKVSDPEYAEEPLEEQLEEIAEEESSESVEAEEPTEEPRELPEQIKKIFDDVEYADDKQYEIGDTCHTMAEKWFEHGVSPLSEVSKTGVADLDNIIEEYFNIRASSFTTSQDIENENLSESVLQYENQRRQELIKMQDRMNIKITDAVVNLQLGEITETELNYTIPVYEWIFYDYDDLDVEGNAINVSGYGIEHLLVIDKENYFIISDSYDESDMTGIKTGSVNDKDTELIPEETNQESEVELMSTFYTNYDVNAVANYANTYVYNYNKAYKDFTPDGGDCANFTSQCIYAGGMPQVVGTNYATNGWFYNTSSNRSSTWTYTPHLVTWMANNRGNMVNNPSSSQIYKGSPVFQDQNSNGVWDHSTICVGSNAEGTPVVNSHTNDRYQVKWNYGYSGTKYCTVQLSLASAPTDPWISFDREANPIYYPGESIVIKFGANNATDYYLGIDQNGVRIDTPHTTENSFTAVFWTPGDYSIYVSCANAWGGCDSRRINLKVGTAPTDPWISFDREANPFYSPGEPIVINFGANNATDYYLGIDQNGVRIDTPHITENSFTAVFWTPADYSIYVSCANAWGGCDSRRINLTVPVDLGSDFLSGIYFNSAIIVNNNSNVEIGEQTGNRNETWRFERQTDGAYTIKSLEDDELMTVGGTSSTGEISVIVKAADGSNEQRWYICYSGNEYKLVPKSAPSFCLDVTNSQTEVGTDVLIYKQHGEANQKFKLIRPSVDLGTEFSADISHTESSVKLVTNNNNVELGTKDSQESWSFERQSDGSYTIKSLVNNKLMTFEADGANVVTKEADGSDSQRWYISYFGNSNYGFVPKSNMFYSLDVYNNWIDPGTNVWTYPINNTAAQRFSLAIVKSQVDLGAGFSAGISHTESSIKLVTNNNNVELGTKDSQESWSFERQSDGSYTIKSLVNNKLMTVEADGSNVVTKEADGSDNQKWYIYAFGSNYEFTPKSNMLYNLDVYNNWIDPGTNIWTYPINDLAAQRFSLSLAVEKVSLNKTSLTLEVGKQEALQATVVPAKANQEVSWSSSDPKVATINGNGTVVAVAAGKATITATSKDGGFTATCQVTVGKKIIGVKLNFTALKLYPGVTKQLLATIAPSDAYNKNLIWRTNNSNVATVNSQGLVTTKAPGSATITVKTADGGFIATCKITVVKKVTGVNLNLTTLTLDSGASKQLTATVAPSDAYNKKLTWTSSNLRVATVDSQGLVKGVAPGTAVIRVKTTDGGFIAACQVNVGKKVTGVKLNFAALKLYPGVSKQLLATIAPSDAYNKNLIWRTNNSNVATVTSQGLVTTKAPGSATITVKTADGGFMATCRVTVVKKVTGVNLNLTSLTLNKGASKQLTATVAPSDAYNKKLTWTSSNLRVATVDSQGLVKGVAPGTAVIRVKTTDGGFIAACQVNVGKKVTGVKLNYAALKLYPGISKQLLATIAPSDAYNKNLIWRTNNSNVVTVNSQGLVTTKAPGSATITVKTADGGFMATCRVTVVKKVTGVNLNLTSLTLNKGASKQLMATVAPSDAYNKKLTWTSSNLRVATVDSQGLVKGVVSGSTVITVKTVDGSFTASCQVTVK